MTQNETFDMRTLQTELIKVIQKNTIIGNLVNKKITARAVYENHLVKDAGTSKMAILNEIIKVLINVCLFFFYAIYFVCLS